MSPRGPNSRRVLNQSTHVKVANSTASRVRHGPFRRITSVFVQADHRLGEGIVIGIAMAADRWRDAGVHEAIRIPHREILAGFKGSSQHVLTGVRVAVR